MFMKERSAATYAKIILSVFTGNELAENSVVDGQAVPLNSDGRRILESGSIMMWTGAPKASKVRPVPTTGGAASADEVQTITRSATPDAGGYSVTVPGFGTTAVLTDLAATALQAAIRALNPLLSATTVALNTQTYTVTFIDRDVAPIEIASNTLTASGSPVTLTVATTAQGELRADQIAGVVMHTTEFWPGTTERDKDDAAVALYTKNCHFAKDQLIGYSGNVAVVKAAMTGAGNDRCANNTFE